MRRSKVAGELRAEQLRATRARTPEQNLAEALALGEQAIAALQHRFGIGREEAIRRYQAQRQLGRRPSVAAGP